MQQILGVDEIDPEYIEIFPVSDLDELGLAGYLIEGCGVDAELVAPERDRLNAVTGYVMLVHSRAFCGQELTLSPKLPLLASFNEPVTDWSGTNIETESAKLNTSTRPPPRQARASARRSGAILFAVFILFIAAILVMVMR